jgi:hypothetical protein
MSITVQEPDVVAFRARLSKMSDEELIRHGRAARCPAAPFSRFGKPPGPNEETLLEECRAEWRRRKLKNQARM